MGFFFRIFSIAGVGGGVFYTRHRLDRSSAADVFLFPFTFPFCPLDLEFTSTQFCGFMKIFTVCLRVTREVFDPRFSAAGIIQTCGYEHKKMRVYGQKFKGTMNFWIN